MLSLLLPCLSWERVFTTSSDAYQSVVCTMLLFEIESISITPGLASGSNQFFEQISLKHLCSQDQAGATRRYAKCKARGRGEASQLARTIILTRHSPTSHQLCGLIIFMALGWTCSHLSPAHITAKGSPFPGAGLDAAPEIPCRQLSAPGL